METTNIYILIDPETHQVRYVGKANNISQRYRAHLNRARKHHIHKLNWVKSLKEKGLKPIIEIIDVVSIDDWVFWETYWIAQFKAWGFKLINYTNGGDGCTFGNQTSFKKGDKAWNDGKGNIKICEVCGNSFKSSKTHTKRSCSDECGSIMKSNSINKGKFEKGTKAWNEGLKGIKLKPDKNVFQYCARTGNFIKSWKTAKEAGEELNINITSIGHCCRGTSKSAGGFIWKYDKYDTISIVSNVKLKIK